MSDHQSIIEFKQLIQSEIGDFFAGLGLVGDARSPSEMQKDLLENIERCFAEIEKKWFLFPSQDLVWMTRDEFNHYCAINKMKPVNLDYIKNFADLERERSKEVLKMAKIAGIQDDEIFFRQDAIEWALLSRGLSREIKKLGGL